MISKHCNYIFRCTVLTNNNGHDIIAGARIHIYFSNKKATEYGTNWQKISVRLNSVLIYKRNGIFSYWFCGLKVLFYIFKFWVYTFSVSRLGIFKIKIKMTSLKKSTRIYVCMDIRLLWNKRQWESWQSRSWNSLQHCDRNIHCLTPHSLTSITMLVPIVPIFENANYSLQKIINSEKSKLLPYTGLNPIHLK